MARECGVGAAGLTLEAGGGNATLPPNPQMLSQESLRGPSPEGLVIGTRPAPLRLTLPLQRQKEPGAWPYEDLGSQ